MTNLILKELCWSFFKCGLFEKKRRELFIKEMGIDNTSLICDKIANEIICDFCERSWI